MRSQVKGDHGDPVFFFQRLGKYIGRLDGVDLKSIEVLVVGKLHQHHRSDGRLYLVEAGDRLGHIVFQHPEVFFFQVGNERAVLG